VNNLDAITMTNTTTMMDSKMVQQMVHPQMVKLVKLVKMGSLR